VGADSVRRAEGVEDGYLAIISRRRDLIRLSSSHAVQGLFDIRNVLPEERGLSRAGEVSQYSVSH
jgi:hypothetical protein